MKLWKRTVLLMLVTLLCALIPVGALSIYVTGNRSLNNAAETYGRQLENGSVGSTGGTYADLCLVDASEKPASACSCIAFMLKWKY